MIPFLLISENAEAELYLSKSSDNYIKLDVLCTDQLWLVEDLIQLAQITFA